MVRAGGGTPGAKRRWRFVALAGVAAALVALLWSAICTTPAVPWNPARLAASAALMEGLPLYALRDSGLHLGWFYGPGFPVWYLPVMWLGNITLLHLAAGVWNAVTYLLPLLLALRAGGVRGRHLAVYGLFGTALLFGHGVTYRNFIFVHVDVVALALGVLACLALHRAMIRNQSAWLHVAAFAAVSAAWSKQIAIALLPALLMWCWRHGGRKMAGRFFLWLVLHGATVTLVVFVWFGTEEVLFNTVLIHLRNPSVGGWPLLWVRLVELLAASVAWLPLLLCGVWLGWRGDGIKLPSESRALVGLFCTVALWQLPLGLSATIKEGGGLNSLHSLHYLMLGGLIWLAFRVPAALLVRPQLRGVAVAMLWLGPLAAGFWFAHQTGARWLPHRGQEELVRLARERPATFYFPWNPLVTVREEGRIQPLDNALFCLWLAGLEPPAERIRAALPSKAVIVYEEPAQSKFALRYFPEYQTGEEQR